MRQTYPDAAYQYPDNIHQHAQAPVVMGQAADLPAKGPQSQERKFQRLQPEWNTNDRNHQQNAGNDIFHADQ